MYKLGVLIGQRNTNARQQMLRFHSSFFIAVNIALWNIRQQTRVNSFYENITKIDRFLTKNAKILLWMYKKTFDTLTQDNDS